MQLLEGIDFITKLRRPKIAKLSIEDRARWGGALVWTFMHGGSSPYVQGKCLLYLKAIESIPVVDYTGDELIADETIFTILRIAFKDFHPHYNHSDDSDKIDLSRELDKGRVATHTIKTAGLFDLENITNRKDFAIKYPPGYSF